jgi:hypothetical protein
VQLCPTLAQNYNSNLFFCSDKVKFNSKIV